MTPKLHPQTDDDILLGMRFITNLDGEVTAIPTTLLVIEEERKREDRRIKREKWFSVFMVVLVIACAIVAAKFGSSNPRADMPTKVEAQIWKTP
jgi:hypothetical protein